MSDDKPAEPIADVEIAETLWKCLLLGGNHYVAHTAFAGWVCARDRDGRSFAIAVRS